jgi:hypothetical protein
MPKKIPFGRYAKGQMQAIRMAEALQVLAATAIKEDFSAENEKELSLERLTYDDYIKELMSAVNNDTVEEFNERLRRLMTPIIDQVLAQQEQQGQPPQPGGQV